MNVWTAFEWEWMSIDFEYETKNLCEIRTLYSSAGSLGFIALLFFFFFFEKEDKVGIFKMSTLSSFSIKNINTSFLHHIIWVRDEICTHFDENKLSNYGLNYSNQHHSG